MGLRFQRRFRIVHGLNLNLSKSGIGISAGVRGAHVGITSRGQRYTSVGLPGTGLSWREYHKARTVGFRVWPLLVVLLGVLALIVLR